VPSLEKINKLTGYRPLADLDTLLTLTIRDIAKARRLPLPKSVAEFALPPDLTELKRIKSPRIPC
jgi:hypothetical protein